MGESKHTVSDGVISDFPRKRARTLRFSLGAPRSAQVVGDGSRALFLRSDGPEDLVTSLWLSVFDREGGHAERLLADPRVLLADAGEEEVPAQERARRERAREGAQGIVTFSVDAAGKCAVFALGGRLWITSITAEGEEAETREIGMRDAGSQQGQLPGPVINPRISPDASLIAYSTGTRIIVVPTDGRGAATTVLGVGPDERTDVTLGLAEFVAGEEMDRYEGFWWSPDSRALVVERADESKETMWYISDPANPGRPAEGRRYPRALTRNAEVSLISLRFTYGDTQGGDGGIVVRAVADIRWDHEHYEYLAALRWEAGQDPVALVQNRLQNKDQVVLVPLSRSAAYRQDAEQDDAASAPRPVVQVEVVEEHSSDTWLDLFPGCPCRTPDGHLLSAVADGTCDSNRLALDGRAFTPAGWQLREVIDVDDSGVLAVASRDPRSFDVVAFGFDGSVQTLNEEPGVWGASRAGAGLVLNGRGMASAQSHMTHTWASDGKVYQANIENHSAEPGFAPRVEFAQLGVHRLQAAIIRPSQNSPYADADSLPVLLKPYGGPGFQQAVFNQAMYWEAQWWADQGFIVLTADGHGTTGRGPAWDRAIFKNMAQVTLDDQIEALQALPEYAPEADLHHVAMIGWSYGGFLSALAVLRAPDAVHAACAGAPPTDWTLYDTHYTERYLGLDPDVYRSNSLLDDAKGLRRPLLLIHGFADDNVSVANTLRLSQALLAEGKDHAVLPLNGITHMTNDETVAENLLIAQRDFLYQALGLR